MFSLNLDNAKLHSAIEDVKRQLNDTGDVLNDVGVYLMGEVQLNFENLSRRGTGVDGTRWDELKPETEWKKARRNRKGPKSKKAAAKKGITAPPQSQVGVDTGRLRNSAYPGKSGNVLDVDTGAATVTVGFGVNHAKFFASDRPLIPKEMPRAWEDGAQQIVDDWFGDILKRNLEK